MIFFIYLICIHLLCTHGSLCVTKVIVRVPKEKDIGLIFDVTVSNNNKGEKREVHGFVVTSDGTCTLNTSKGEQVKNVGRIFGGDFGIVEPGKIETVSLVWPTVSLYNRVGTCPIIISTANSQNEMSHALQLLHFDTRFETLDPDKHSLRKRKEFTDCKNWDKDYFRNCTPLNCEERYFGQRSFYNYETEQCETVTACSSADEYYDIYANECVDKNNFITEDELEQIKSGKFENNYLELRGSVASSKKNKGADSSALPPSAIKGCPSKLKPGGLSFEDFTICFQHLEKGIMEDQYNPFKVSQPDKILQKKSIQGSSLTRFYYDWYLPWRSENIEENKDQVETDKDLSDSTSSGADNSLPWRLQQLNTMSWVELISKGMFIFALTCCTYVFVCIGIYGFLKLVARLDDYEETADDLSRKLTPVDTESHHTIATKESLMSHR